MATAAYTLPADLPVKLTMCKIYEFLFHGRIDLGSTYTPEMYTATDDNGNLFEVAWEIFGQHFKIIE